MKTIEQRPPGLLPSTSVSIYIYCLLYGSLVSGYHVLDLSKLSNGTLVCPFTATNLSNASDATIQTTSASPTRLDRVNVLFVEYALLNVTNGKTGRIQMSATCLCSNTSLLANFSESGSAWFLALLQSGASYQSRSSGTGIASRIVSNISQLFPGEALLPVGNSTPQMLANLSCVDAPTDTSTTAGEPAAGMKVNETMRACIGGGGVSDCRH
jgi:hypothetical protein